MKNKPMTYENHESLRPIRMKKHELARQYFPELDKIIATKKLLRWINGNPFLMKSLEETGYKKRSKEFSPHQTALILEAFGDP